MFNPTRLNLARRRRALTKRELSALVAVSDRSISGFEAGDIAPADRTVSRIATSLRFPRQFFFGLDLPEIPEGAASFRAMSKITAAQRHSALAAGTLTLALCDWLDQRFRVPVAAIPRLGPGADPETAAAVVRAEWGLGERPVANMIHLLEAHGVRVFSLAEDTRVVDAFSFWRSETPFIFLNTKKSAEHSRFDAAHELGHLVLHWHHELPQGREAEKEAHRFASALLMPRAAIAATAPRFPAMATLMAQKRYWRVSLSAYIYRLHKLSLLSEWHYRTLNVELSNRGFRIIEPHGVPNESSQVLEKMFSGLRRDGTTKEQIAAALLISPSDLDSMVFGLTLVPLKGGAVASASSPARLRLVG